MASQRNESATSALIEAGLHRSLQANIVELCKRLTIALHSRLLIHGGYVSRFASLVKYRTLTITFTDSVSPAPNSHWSFCRGQPLGVIQGTLTPYHKVLASTEECESSAKEQKKKKVRTEAKSLSKSMSQRT
ncbi:hypothetical protein CRG98_010217 [Punica granatum]|uniref:Uncharacterized protein n=1 Tax=Punica granatum TaxID=22663 RepID=A0A2I0KLU4_PUNGR|nr:hypothetical protein CRG98_010217 [Punica granatum]